jgi:hypothetical protein
MCNSVAAQLVGYDLARLTLVISEQSLEEALSSRTIAFSLKINIYHFAILVYRVAQPARHK